MLDKNILSKVFNCLLILLFLNIFPNQVLATNSAMAELINILYKKGSVSEDEFQLLKNATMADQEQTTAARAEIKKDVKNETNVATKSIDAASWASKISLKGDARMRYSGKKEEPNINRDRGRVRYRLGVIAQPTSGWEVGAGLASGTDDLRSTNQTFGDTFSTKGIHLDYAYTQYKFNDSIKAVAGKLKYSSYLYTASDLLWDGDINPEGFSTNFNHKSELGTTFFNSGVWVIAESSKTNNDPFMVYAQLGQNFGSENLFGTLAGTYYSFEDNTALGSFLTDGSNSDYHFGGIYALSGEVGLKNLLGNGTKASIYTDWVTNGDTSTDADNGYLVGVKASNGPWSLNYSYADLEQNAWPDIFADSDRFDGLTGIRGHEIVLSYNIMKNVVLAVDYYIMESKVLNEDQRLLQLDLNVRF
ncbi:MAG: hypothetical protein ACI9XC_002572 [Gammaproteobacteria bacterium]|jgi:hypothetical protein